MVVCADVENRTLVGIEFEPAPSHGHQIERNHETVLILDPFSGVSANPHRAFGESTIPATNRWSQHHLDLPMGLARWPYPYCHLITGMHSSQRHLHG